ncbi:MAG: PP0621 family protein [Acidobacteriota bacterium]
MRDAIFILFVALILLGITAIKYRKQIAGMIGIARMLKEATQPPKPNARAFQENNAKSIPLVNCTKCGVWVPQNKARKVGDLFFCSDECVQMQKSA